MRWIRRNRTFLIGVAFLLPFVVAALIPGLLAVHDPNETLTNPFVPPSSAYPLGTDEIGRDLLSRVIFAARTDLGVSLASTLIALVVGASVGLTVGYLGGVLDVVMMRLTDVLLSFPSILLALFLITILGRDLTVEIAALSVLFVPGFLRLSRGLALTTRVRGYVDASLIAGGRTVHITRTHLLPSAAGPLLVGTALTASAALLTSSTLSYLGLGPEPPASTWGNMLQSSFEALFLAPWYGVIPGLCITLVALGYTWLADGIQEMMDPSGRHFGAKRIMVPQTAAYQGLLATAPQPASHVEESAPRSDEA